MVILEAVTVIVGVVTQISLVMDALLLSGDCKGSNSKDAEGC